MSKRKPRKVQEHLKLDLSPVRFERSGWSRSNITGRSLKKLGLINKHLFLLLHVRNVVNSLSCGLWVWTLHSVDPQSLQKSAYSVTSHTDTQRWHTTPPRVLTYMLLCRHRAWPPTPFCEMLQPNISLRKKSSSRSHKSVQRQDHPRHTHTHTHKQWQPLSSDVDGCHSSKSTNHLHSKDDDDRWCHCLPWAELL